MAIRADCRLVVAKHRSLRPGVNSSGNRPWAASATLAQSRWLKVVWASSASALEVGQRGDIVDRFDPVDRFGGDGHGADGLLVALVADVDDLVALAGSDLDLVVDLGDERADGVDDIAAPLAGLGHHRGGRTVRRQHDGSPFGHLADVVDEDHARSMKRSTTSLLWTISW